MKQFKSQININSQTTGYIVGSELLANLHKIKEIKNRNYSSFLLLSDKNTYKLYGDSVKSSSQKLNKKVCVSLLPVGEKYKNLASLSALIQPYFKFGFNRNSCLLALGGGVITDIGGFLASILLRGIDSIFLPTSLLAQIDAAIGGKNGVNFETENGFMFKNMLGTIYQPSFVISDIDVLNSLPDREIQNGLAEMVKYWIGWGKPNPVQLEKFKHLEDNHMNSFRVKEIISTISECQKIKIGVVEKDPFELTGIRQKLNLGHTIGHAIEAAARGKLKHGQCVAVGLVACAKISLYQGLLSQKDYQEIIEVIKKLEHHHIIFSSISRQKVLQAMELDKKGGTFVLIEKIGRLKTGVKVDKSLIKKVLKEILL